MTSLEKNIGTFKGKSSDLLTLNKAEKHVEKAFALRGGACKMRDYFEIVPYGSSRKLMQREVGETSSRHMMRCISQHARPSA